MVSPKISKVLSGVAGEYFVAAELSRRGYIASITLRNTQNIDIIASNQSGTRSVAIQVKTNQGSHRQWLLTKKAETMEAENLFYVFVSLNGPEGTPSYYVVHSSTVAEHCRKTHKAWLSGSKRDGTARKDSSMRVFRDTDARYLGAWDNLGIG